MSNDQKMPPTKMVPPQPDPFNIQATKRYVYNETGNIMLATTDSTSDQIQQDVRDVFAEVSVFFAAMTRAMATAINPDTGKNYSIYDYAAIEGIVNGSGLFIQVSEEDVVHKIDSWGVTVSKALIEGILGLATGSGELAFAQAMVNSIGKRGLQIGASSDKTDTRVGTIVFVCEYLLGMPIVSALVVYIDSQQAGQQFKLGPCVNEHSGSLKLTMHKDTYMFVTPNAIRKYSGDLLSVESDLQYLELVDYLQDLVERKPNVTMVVDEFGKQVLTELSMNVSYRILGSYLCPVGASPEDIVIQFVGGDDLTCNNPQADVVGFTATATSTVSAPVGVYLRTKDAAGNYTGDTTLLATTTDSFIVVNAMAPEITALLDQDGNPVSGDTLYKDSKYRLSGLNFLDPKSPTSVPIVMAYDGQNNALPALFAHDGLSTDTEINFTVMGTTPALSPITIGVASDASAPLTAAPVVALNGAYDLADPATPTFVRLVDKNGMVVHVLDPKGNPLPNVMLKVGDTYTVEGTNLLNKGTAAQVTVSNAATSNVAVTGTPTNSAVSFLVTSPIAAPATISIKGGANAALIIDVVGSFTAAYPRAPAFGALVDKSGTPVKGTVLTVGSVYTIQGTNLLGFGPASAVTVFDASTGSNVVLSGTPTNSAVSFKVSTAISAAATITIGGAQASKILDVPTQYTAK